MMARTWRVPLTRALVKFPARKVCLIDISLVLNGMFFGPMKETGEMIEVKETFPGAFCNMIIDDQPPLQDSWRTFNPQ